MFNNWAVFHEGRFITTHLLNEGYLAKMLDKLKEG
ncbi:MAG: YoaP domain-containing protein [Christensenellales bacterium]